MGSAQTCCLKLETQSEGTLDNELLRIGCEKLSRRFSISKIGSCENPSFYLQLSGLEEVYILESLNAIYIDPITLDEIVVNLNYSTSVVNGFLIIDVQEIFFKHPLQSDYILALFEYKFDMLHGNPQFPNGVPSYFGLALAEKCNVNDSWVNYDIYGGLNAVGIRVSGNWTDLENDPVIFDILRKHGGVYIEDELIIDRDGLTFDGYDFTFAPGAQLVLKNGTSGNFFGGSFFRGCSEMYHGTKLETSASAKFEGSMVSGAEIGIYADISAKLILEGNTITHCAIGVKGNSANIQSLENLFTTDPNEVWLPYYTGQTEFPLENKMNVGILTNNSTVLFDQGSTYSKIWNGVESNSSLIQVEVSNFTDIIPYNNQYQMYGNGILTKDPGGSKFSNLNGNTMNDCGTGIRIIGSRTLAQGNEMKEMDYGIVSTNTSAPIDITENEIESKIYGIHLNSNTGSWKKIWNNNPLTNIGNQNIDDGCIYVDNSRAITTVKGNYMNVQGGIFGFRITPGIPAYVNNNTGVLTNSFRSHGYGFHLNGNRSNLACNTTIGPSSTNKDLFGYQLTMANANFNCNLSTGGRRGFNVSGSNQASSFKGNEVGGNYGLLVEENARLGISANLVHQGNCWPGSNIKDALNKNQVFVNVNSSQFTVDHEENNCYLPDWEAQGNWFDNRPDNSSSYSCGSLCPNGGVGAGFGSEVCDYADELLPLVSGEITYTAFQNEHRWVDRFQVYHLLTEANCQDLSNSVQLFMEQVGNSEIGKLVLVESGLNSLAIEANDPNQLLLDSLHILQDILLDQLNVMSVMNWFTWDTIIVVDLTDQINSIQLLLDSLMEINTEDRNAFLEDLIDFNSNISVSTAIATQLKFVNDLQIRSMMDHDFEMTETEESELYNIAILCPDEGGYATLKARGLLHQMGYNQVFDDRPCHESTIQPIILKLPTEKLIVLPNPVYENVWISTSSGQAMMDLVLYDPIGREILKQSKMEENNIYLDMSGFPCGNYIFQATLSNGDFVRTKINIIR